MGRVIKADDLARRPVRLADRDRGRSPDPAAGAFARAVASRDREVVKLATEMARRLVGDAVDRDPTALIRMYEETVRHAGGLEPASLRINPSDLSEALGEVLTGVGGLEVVEDPDVERFGCVLEAHGIRVERSIGTMAAMLMEGLGEERK